MVKTTTPLSNFVPSHDVAPNIYVMLKEEITIFGISLKKKKILFFIFFILLFTIFVVVVVGIWFFSNTEHVVSYV